MTDHHVHRLRVSLPLATAARIVEQALAAGTEAGLLPLTVAVRDVGGNIALVRRHWCDAGL